jgi:hypothetical protein
MAIPVASTLDFESNSRIINLPAALSGGEPIRKTEFDAATTWTEVEIDFGSGTGVSQKRFIITEPSCTSLSKISVCNSGKVASGRVGDDAEWDSLILTAKAGTGDFILIAYAYPGPVKGKRNIMYQIGS